MAQYLKPDSELGYVEDSAEIGNLKFNNLRHVVLGCMLGDFNEVGDYIVSPEIVSELIAMEKYFVQTFDNIELCKSCLKLDKQISFMVVFEGNRATLSLVEKINYEANLTLNSGTYSNINEYLLDSVETSGEINHNAIYERWNIKQYGGNVVDIFNCDDSILEKYFGIVNRFKYLLEANKIMLEKEEVIEEIEAGYTNDIMSILDHYPTLKQEVIKTIKETLEENKNSVSVKKPYFIKTFNEILENAIEKNIEVLNETEKKEFVQEKRNATVNLNIKREDAIDMVRVQGENVAEKDMAPQIPKLKTTTQYKSVTELGEDLVGQDKKVEMRISDELQDGKSEPEQKTKEDLIQRTILALSKKSGQELKLSGEDGKVEGNKGRDKSEESEKRKLIGTLTVIGIATAVGIKPPKENVKKVTNDKQEADSVVKAPQAVATKKTAGSDSSAKTDSAKKSDSAKKAPAVKKQESVKKPGGEVKKPPKTLDKTNGTKVTIITRIFSDGTAETAPAAPNNEQRNGNTSDVRVPDATPDAAVGGKRVGESNGNRTVGAREVKASILDIVKQVTAETETKLVNKATVKSTVSATQVADNEQESRNAELSNANAKAGVVDAEAVSVQEDGVNLTQ